MTNTTSGGSETITFTPKVPNETAAGVGTLNLGNSGSSGTNFYVGGTISLSSATVDGVYSGDMDVTVNY